MLQCQTNNCDIWRTLKARASAKTGVFIPARTIAENILTEECGEEDVARPRVNLLKRAVNHARARLRPKEPETLDFEVIGEPFKRNGQLFTINAFFDREGASKQLSLAFVLMSRRTQADYELVFRAVLERLGNVEVEGFVADFEVGYHNRLNSKAGSGVGFYRQVPHLRQESEIVRMLVEGSDLHRITTTRSAKVQKTLVSLWDMYEAKQCTSSEFLARSVICTVLCLSNVHV
ncbi:hypothetical protein DPMN_064297 [Dreissena polymorpha]|uniref:MULE transposase domain-containing protein n=1 Tax=Dreissena polymorpha TaxID=45954 RepID=A0A9D4CCY0_DREPO|nr:hypothetical protein DPMN_064297 [Dreissena polymorpha]